MKEPRERAQQRSAEPHGSRLRSPAASAVTAPLTDNRRWQKSLIFGAAVAALYLTAVLAVIYLDYSSEVAKLARGAYTDTFSPLGLARVAAWPGSYLGPLSDYPDGPFNAVTYRAALRPSLQACLRAAPVQAVLVFLIGTVIDSWRRVLSRR